MFFDLSEGDLSEGDRAADERVLTQLRQKTGATFRGTARKRAKPERTAVRPAPRRRPVSASSPRGPASAVTPVTIERCARGSTWAPTRATEHTRIGSVAEAAQCAARAEPGPSQRSSRVARSGLRCPGSPYPTGREFVPRRRHRMEPVRRPLPRLPRPVIAAGVGAALLGVGVALAVPFWPNTDSGPATQAITAAATDDGRRDAVLALMAEDKTSRDRTRRDRTRSPAPTTPIAQPPAVVGQLWATTDIAIRSGPSAGHDRISSLKAVTRVDITGVTEHGWTQVVTDRRAGWVKSTYLSKTKPKPKPQPKPKPKPQPKPATPGVSDAPCPISPDIESHLTSHARSVYRAACAAYGSSVSSFGGYRAGDSGDHGSGRAVDIMVSGEPGSNIARYVQAHARELGVAYVIYQQKIWQAGNPTSRWKAMEDRGSTTANHYDHVHVSVS